MEMNNTNPPVNPTETPIQPVQQFVNNQSGNFPIILGVLVLLLVVGGGAYYLGTQKNNPAQLSQNSQHSNPTPTATSEPSPSANHQTYNADWKTYSGDTTYNGMKVSYSISYPPKWAVDILNGYIRFLPEEQKENPQIVFWVTPPERELPELKTTKEFPAGNAKYYVSESYGWAYFDQKGFEFTAPKEEFTTYLPTFNKILSTVKFTN